MTHLKDATYSVQVLSALSLKEMRVCKVALLCSKVTGIRSPPIKSWKTIRLSLPSLMVKVVILAISGKSLPCFMASFRSDTRVSWSS